MTKIAIIDYEMGNLFSVERACEYAGLNYFVTSDKKSLLSADAAILPGVGAFCDAMASLNKFDLISPIRDFIASGRPFIGICLGMQLLMSESEEFGVHKGIGIFKGSVKKFTSLKSGNYKVPQVGWNSIYPPEGRQNSWRESGSPLINTRTGEYMYFVHSFCCVPEDKNLIYTVTNYEGIDYCSGIFAKNVFACQFHPEKSGIHGLNIYKQLANTAINTGGINEGY